MPVKIKSSGGGSVSIDVPITGSDYTLTAPTVNGNIVSTANAFLLSSAISVTGTTTLSSSAFGVLHQCSGTTSDYTVTLPAVSGNAGKILGFQMSTALTKLVTLDGNASETIDGSLTRIMWAGESAILYCDGNTWSKIGGKTIPMIANQYKGGSSQTVGTGSSTKLTLGTAFGSNCPSAMNDTTNSKVVIVRPGYYATLASSRTQNNPVSFGGQEVLLYKNGSEYTINSKYSTSGDWSPIQVGINDSASVGDYYETYARQYSGQNATYFANIMNFLCISEIPQW